MPSPMPTLSGPGIILSGSHISKPDLLSDDLFNKWYNTVHIPDVLSTGGVTRATRYTDANPSAKNKYISIYEIPDLSITSSEAFKNIPMTSGILPDGANIHDLANFDTRFYELVQVGDGSDEQEEWFPSIVSAGVQPSPTQLDIFDRYMRDEHLEQMSREPAWKRSRRYKLVHSIRAAENPTEYLTLYEFGEGDKLGKEVEACVPMTEGTKNLIDTAVKFELGVYRRIGAFS
ncbi:hypothetical protein EJ08DRAFT_255884 [Tothia fuscella]|uniref:Uncharacterized protein n=1 Tax=Tothia fuscella TaxID=1048955 RepID=A0A9P4NRL8_9PEZI|nr:hypothetical protein EJ08DRAFT_255884 [Tothia fuscella]